MVTKFRNEKSYGVYMAFLLQILIQAFEDSVVTYLYFLRQAMWTDLTGWVTPKSVTRDSILVLPDKATHDSSTEREEIVFEWMGKEKAEEEKPQYQQSQLENWMKRMKPKF